MRISTFFASLSLCEEAYSVHMFYRYFDILKIASNNTSSWLATKHLQRAEFHMRKKKNNLSYIITFNLVKETKPVSV